MRLTKLFINVPFLEVTNSLREPIPHVQLLCGVQTTTLHAQLSTVLECRLLGRISLCFPQQCIRQ